MKSRSTQTTRRAASGWVVALTAIGSLMAALDTLVVSTALSTIRLDLGSDGPRGYRAHARGQPDESRPEKE